MGLYIGTNHSPVGGEIYSNPFLNAIKIMDQWWPLIVTDQGNGHASISSNGTAEDALLYSTFLDENGYPTDLTGEPTAEITASITGKVMTVTSAPNGLANLGVTISGAGIHDPTYITRWSGFGNTYTGDGGTGTYEVCALQNVGSSGSPIALTFSGGATGTGFLKGALNPDRNIVASCWLSTITLNGTVAPGETVSGTGIESGTVVESALASAGDWSYVYADYSVSSEAITCTAAHSFNSVGTILFHDLQTAGGEPPGVTDLYFDGGDPNHYHVEYDGTGTLCYNYRADITGLVSRTDGHDVVTVVPSASGMGIIIATTGSGDNHLRNLRVTPHAYRSEALSGNIFHPEFLAKLGNPWKCHRMMPWQNPYGDYATEWADRNHPEWVSWSNYGHRKWGHGQGVPYEVQIALCNETHSDLWLCIPLMTSYAYKQALAALVKSTLNRPLKCYVEYSNELWNNYSHPVYAYLAADYISRYDLKIGGTTIEMSGWNPAFAVHAVETWFAAQAFRAEFTGDDVTRLKIVYASWGGYVAIMRDGDCAVTSGTGGAGGKLWDGMIGDNCDCLSVAPYFGDSAGCALAAYTDPSFPGNSSGSIAGGLDALFEEIFDGGTVPKWSAGGNTMTGTSTELVLTSDAGWGDGAISEPIDNGTIIQGYIPSELALGTPPLTLQVDNSNAHPINMPFGNNGTGNSPRCSGGFPWWINSNNSGASLAAGKYAFCFTCGTSTFPAGKSRCTDIAVVNGGTNYQSQDTITLSNGVEFICDTNWETGAITGVTYGGLINMGMVDTGSEPSNPVSVVSTGSGLGSGATFNLTWFYYTPAWVIISLAYPGGGQIDATMSDPNYWGGDVATAAQYGMELNCYEMGESLVDGARTASYYTDNCVVQMLSQASRDTRMGQAYIELFSRCAADTDGVLLNFNDCSKNMQWGNWGILENIVQSGGSPKYNAVVSLIGLPATLSDYVLDNGLEALNDADEFYLCYQFPTNFSDVSTYALGSRSGSIFSAVGDGSGGRKVSLNAFSDGTVTEDGIGTTWVAVDSVNSRLLAFGPLAINKNVYNGGTFGFDSFDVTLLNG